MFLLQLFVCLGAILSTAIANGQTSAGKQSFTSAVGSKHFLLT